MSTTLVILELKPDVVILELKLANTCTQARPPVILELLHAQKSVQMAV